MVGDVTPRFKSSLIDVFLTNKPRSFSGTLSVDIGVSDFHNFIGAASKMHAPDCVKRKINYRRMKDFDEKSFQHDINSIPFHVCDIFDDIDDIYWAQNSLFMPVVEKHAPLKTRVIHKPQAPYMNSELRKAMNQRNMWRNKHFKNRGNEFSGTSM